MWLLDYGAGLYSDFGMLDRVDFCCVFDVRRSVQDSSTEDDGKDDYRTLPPHTSTSWLLLYFVSYDAEWSGRLCSPQ